METDDSLATNIQKSFLDLLHQYLPKNLSEKKEGLKILSIGCGRIREAKCLFEYFSNCSDQINFYGIDIVNEMLELAKSDPDIIKRKEQIHLKLGDASDKNIYTEWLDNGQFDLIILRHPEITFNTEPFIKIFTISKELLQTNGYLFITTHFENEKESIKLLLKLLKYDLLIEAENKSSASFKKGEDLVFADKFLLVASINNQ